MAADGAAVRGAGRRDGGARSPVAEPSAGVLTARSARVRRARALLVGNRRDGEFLAEGPQAVGEALGAGAALEVLVSVDASGPARELADRARSAGIGTWVVERAGFAGLVGTRTPQGVVARCAWRQPGLPEVLAVPGPGQLVLAHEMSDPGNAGALIRVADAVGARAVALSDNCVDPTNPKCVRSTAGSLFHLPVVRAGATMAALEQLSAAGYRTLAADAGPHSLDLFQAESAGLLRGRVAWVLGNEAHGLPDEVLDGCAATVRVPILGRAESLNLATAAAVCLYGYARQSLA